MASAAYHREHLQSFVATKQAYFDAKAAAHHRAAPATPPSTKKSSPVAQETVRDVQQMEKIHDSVLDAIHAALSKETLVKKLVLPFNETLASATQGAASSRWEWQKNTALLELENRNQHLQHLLSQAGRDAMEQEARAQEGRKVLEEALQRGKEEAVLLAKARDMRARLIEQMRVMARGKHLQATLCAWRHFCGKSRKKRALRRAERMWRARTMLRLFHAFASGCDRTRRALTLSSFAAGHRCRTLLLAAIRVWWRGAALRRAAKDRLRRFTSFWARYRLRLVLVGWQNHCVQLALKGLNGRRAIRLLYFTLLRRAWRGWTLRAAAARESRLTAELFVFLRVARECLRNWHGLVRKKQRARQLEMGGQQRQAYLVRAAMDTWLGRARLAAVMAARLHCFLQRKERRLKCAVAVRWWRHAARTRAARALRAQLASKIERRCKEWAFQAVRKNTVYKALLEEHKVQRCNRTRGTVVKLWLHEVRARQARRLWMRRLLRQFRHRQLYTLFSSWLLRTESCKRQNAEEKAHEAEARAKVLQTELAGAAQVKVEMERLLAGFEAERSRIMDDAGAAIARTPSWTSGFLDAELRWSAPPMGGNWLPPGRAGHSAVPLPLRPHGPPSTVVFGGYNGRECFNDVLIFDCGFDGAYEFSDLSLLTFSDQGKSCEWSQPERRMGAMPASFSHHTACVTRDGRHMVVFGGYRSCVGHLNETWLLDLHSMEWTSPDPVGVPPSPRRGHSAAVVADRMYVLGGYNGGTHLADLHALDVEAMAWERVDALGGNPPTPRRQHAMAAVGRHLVVFGGYDGTVYLDDTYVFDTESRVWKRWPIMGPTAKGGASTREWAGEAAEPRALGRSMHTMAEAGPRLVIFGGVHERGALRDVLFLENAAAMGGLQLQTSLLEETAKVHNLQANVVGCEWALQEKSTELALAHSKLLQVHSALKVEAEKRTAAVEGQRVLLTKLQKARIYSNSLSQTCRRLEVEQKTLQHLVAEYEQQRVSALQATQQKPW